MKSLKIKSMEGLRELRDSGLKSLKIRGFKNSMVNPEESRTERISDAKLEDLKEKRGEIEKEIRKLNQEKKGIETRIHMIRKTEKKTYEEITEFPWREDIFPPLRRKTYSQAPEIPEVKDSFSYGENPEIPEIKGSEMKIKAEGTDEKPEDRRWNEKMHEETASPIVQNIISNSQEVTCPETEIEKKVEEKTFPEKEEKTKTVYPFSAEKLSENKNSSKDSGKNSIETRKTENKNNHATSLLGESLLEELLSSDDLSSEEEQGFMKYLQEPEIGELINELKDTRSLLAKNTAG